MTQFSWMIFVCCIAEVLPFRLLAYYPFGRQLRVPVPAAVSMTIAVQLLQALSAGTAGAPYKVIQVLFAGVQMCLYLAVVRTDPWKAVFFYIFLLDYSMVIRGAAYVSISLWYTDRMQAFPNPYTATLVLLLFATTAPLTARFLHKMREHILQTNAPALWRVIWTLPAFTTLIVMMYPDDISSESVLQPRFLAARILLLVMMFLTYDVLLYAINMLRRQTALTERASQQETMLAMQNTQYQQLTRHIQEAARATHDLRQQIRIIRGYLHEGNREELDRYLEKYEQSLPPEINFTFCRNYAVNTLVSYYAEEARKAAVDFSVYLKLPDILCVGEPELCALLGNLLENALDACRGVTECAPFIRVRAQQENGRIALVVDNTCLHPPEEQNGRFFSSKHEGFGTGTASVRSIAEQWGGTAEFRCENHVFYVSVLLFAREENEQN